MVNTKQTLARNLPYECSIVTAEKSVNDSVYDKAWDILGIPRILWFDLERKPAGHICSTPGCYKQTWHIATPHIWAWHPELNFWKSKTSPIISFCRHIFQSSSKPPNKQRNKYFPQKWIITVFFFFFLKTCLEDGDSINGFVLAMQRA